MITARQKCAAAHASTMRGRGDCIRIAINGTGVAGPTLAYRLRRLGHEPVLFEKAGRLRTGGYVIDFWGLGFEIAERMGLVPALLEQKFRAVREGRVFAVIVLE